MGFYIFAPLRGVRALAIKAWQNGGLRTCRLKQIALSDRYAVEGYTRYVKSNHFKTSVANYIHPTIWVWAKLKTPNQKNSSFLLSESQIRGGLCIHGKNPKVNLLHLTVKRFLPTIHGFLYFRTPWNVVRMAVAACLWPTTFIKFRVISIKNITAWPASRLLAPIAATLSTVAEQLGRARQ